MTISVACLQIRVMATAEENRTQLARDIQTAAKQGAKLIVLPELHNTPYFCQCEDTQYFDWAEPIPGPSTDFFSALAKTHNVVIVASLFERRGPGIHHNTACVFETDGRLGGRYRKMHIPDDPGYYEKFYFVPGDLGFTPIRTSVGCLGILVCWDQWFPEAARLMAIGGAELLIYPTAIGWERQDTDEEQKRQLNAWITIQRAHAIANGLPVLVCNRVGFESHPSKEGQGIDFWGHSFIAGPQGEFLATASSHEPEILSGKIDLAHAEKIRRLWQFRRDRRIDHYDHLLEHEYKATLK